jgi:hypothetical protein
VFTINVKEPIYVEILVRAPMDTLWNYTQTPALHEKWDLRFSRIDYLPKECETEPQRFRYTTRIGFGLEVKGVGESVGYRNLADGSRSSALKFGSSDSLAIIREGSGYWKYIPTAAGIRFLTSYDYRTRSGAAGALFDRLVFRPLIGWATAWSFDRLRLWLEQGMDPAQAMRQTLVHVVARITVAVVFAQQVLSASCSFSLNVAAACLAAVDILTVTSLPSATRCRRRPSWEKA